MSQDNKIYDSLFLNEKVDIANYITEHIIVNRCKIRKQNIPNSPFWRKDIAKNNPILKDLSKVYIAELSNIHELLLVFSPRVILQYIKENNTGFIKLASAHNKLIILSGIYKKQLEYIKESKNTVSSDIQSDENAVIQQSSYNSMGKSKSITL